MTNASTNNRNLRLTGTILYILGFLLVTALAAIAIIADYESVFYGFEGLGAKKLRTLSCPVLLTPNSPGYVHATIHNPNDKVVELMMRVSFSSPGLFEYEKYREIFEPGETKKLSWPITEKNVDLKRFAFAHIGHFANSNIPFSNANCGMMMIHFPLLSGDQLFFLWFAAGLGSLTAGLYLWYRGSQPIEGRRRQYYQYMRFLAIITLLTLLVGLLCLWVIGIPLLAIVALTVVSLLMLPMMSN